MSDSFNFQASVNTPISDGATALKLEDEVNERNDSELNANSIEENVGETTAHVASDNIHETQNIEKNEINVSEPSNGLKTLDFKTKEVSNFSMKTKKFKTL